MPLVDVPLPLDPLLFSSHWAWLIALCLATVATFSRLSPFSSFMDSPSVSSFISSRHVKPDLHPATKETALSDEGDLSSSESNKAVCNGQTESGEKIPWSSLHTLQSGSGEEDEIVAEDDGEEVHPLWVSSLLEASRSQSVVSRTPALACASCVQASSWSQDLHRQISVRMGIPWHRFETRVQMSLDHQVRLPCVAENLCNRNVSKKMWQEWQMLQFLQVPSTRFTISSVASVEVGIHDGFTHVGYCNGKIALWDVEKKVCLNRLCDRESSGATLFASPPYPRLAIATGWSAYDQTCSIVSFWDDRSALRCGNLIVSISARWMKAFESRGHELGIAGDGYVTRHDLRMLKRDPIAHHAAESMGKLAWEGQINENKGSECKIYELNSVTDEAEEELITYVVMDRTCSDYSYEGSHRGSKRRCFLISCLAFICGVSQNL